MKIVDRQRPLRIIIADPHPSSRENLRYLLSAERDLEVVGVVRDAATALRLTLKLRPDVLVIDFDLAAPGSVAWELAVAACFWAPLWDERDIEDSQMIGIVFARLQPDDLRVQDRNGAVQRCQHGLCGRGGPGRWLDPNTGCVEPRLHRRPRHNVRRKFRKDTRCK